MKFLCGGSGSFGASFLFHMLRAIGNFVVDLLDLQREMKFIGMLCVLFEKRIPLRL